MLLVLIRHETSIKVSEYSLYSIHSYSYYKHYIYYSIDNVEYLISYSCADARVSVYTPQNVFVYAAFPGESM